ESMYSHFQMSNVDSSIFSNFLKNKNIKRVELDNLIQGIDRPKKSLKGSLYFPFGYVTTTRFCLSNFSIRDDIKVLRGVYECNKNCQNTMVKLKHKDMPIDLYLKGNTQFFKNDNVSKKLNHLNIDRLVFQPEIPL
ncbi:MAG: hypothetical protein KAJ14_12295, partial [Candidatus Omnitrophica bacterium]|nr:hypothetical protein [Candidatus Omnitrophota bacterium]